MKRNPLNLVSAAKVIEMKTRADLRKQLRSERGHTCERCACAPWVHMHERLSRSRGGSATDPENIALLCAGCHRWVHDNPADALAAGWLRSQWRPDV